MTELEFRLPDVGEGLAEAEIVRWVVPEGGAVRRMAPIVEIETAKSVVEIPSPVTGTLVRHGADEGQVLDVGAVLAILAAHDEEPALPAHPVGPAPPGAPSVGRPAAPPDATAGAAAAPPPSPAPTKRVPAAPTVRRLAAELGVPLAQVPGSGPGGRVLADDVRRASAERKPAPAAAPSADDTEPPAADRTERLSPMRMTIMRTLAQAWAQVPTITDMRDVDAAELTRVRAALAEEMDGQKPSYTTLFAGAVVAALRRHPVFNASLDAEAGTVTHHADVHLGIAVSVEGGLVVGVVRRAQAQTLRELGQSIATVADRARAGALSAQESRGATFTLSSFGQFGGWYGTPLVVPPQVAIAGFGPIKDKVVAVEGQPAVRPTLAMSVSADHRLIDGAELSAFCSTVERLVAEPVRILGG